jgi:replicative DNA helicase
VRSDWEEPVNLYIAVALKPGESKSPAFAKAIQPIVRFVAEQWKCLEPQIKTATARYDIVSKRIEQLKARAAKEDDPGERATIANEVDKALMEQAALQVPILPRLIVDDATAESLELVMRQQGGRIGIFSDEGGPFELMGGRYSDGIPNLDVYLKGHSGSSISTDRIGRVGGSVQNPAITIGLAIQPDVIMELHAKKGFRGRGLLARFLWVVPQSRVGTRHGDSPPVPRTVQETYEAAVTRLLSAPMERDKQGEIISRAIPIDERAYAILVAFKDTIEPALGSSGDLEAIADWGNKLPGTVVRLACLLHLADRAGETDLSPNLVGEREMLRALQISEFLCAHARIAFDMMDSDPIARSARHVLAWIQRTGATSFTGHQAYQALRAHFRAPAEMEAPLGLLIDHEIIRQRPAVPRTGPGRKPTPTYDVNPAIHARNTRNAHCPAFQLGNGDSVHFVQGSEEPISQSSDLPVQERRPTDHV